MARAAYRHQISKQIIFLTAYKYYIRAKLQYMV